MDIKTASDCETRGYAHDFITDDNDAARTVCRACGGSWDIAPSEEERD